MTGYDVVVVGGGLLGLTAARELAARGGRVVVVDPGPLPHPLAASADLSKVVRTEYGADTSYAALAERAREGWLRWNDDLFGEPLYHEVGMAFLTQQELAPGGYEYENLQSLARRGHAPERLDRASIARRFPAWNAAVYGDGYFNPKAGWVESGRVVERLATHATSEGVAFRLGERVRAPVARGGRVVGVTTEGGDTIVAEQVLVAAGAWTPLLVPDLLPTMRATGQPVFYLKPADPTLFAPPWFPVFAADSARTGWYGFPVHPAAGVIKVANHGPGRAIHPTDDPRLVEETDERRLRAFLVETFPALADAPIAGQRCCLYCDTPDEHFWIGRHPGRPGLAVASGDSGHAFKFGPVLGPLIADAVEGKSNPEGQRFAWRSVDATTVGQEASRFRGESTALRAATR